MSQIGKSLVIVFVLFVTSCVSTDYVGISYDATDSVQVYYDEENITVAYEIIGRALGEGHRFRKVRSKLVERAKEEGADAILIDGLGKDTYANNNYTLNGQLGVRVSSKDQINATFLRYK